MRLTLLLLALAALLAAPAGALSDADELQ